VSRAVLERPGAAPFARTLDILSGAQGRIFTGATLHVRHRGQVACEAAFGVLTPDGPPVRSDSPFDLASITKIFTATAALALFDERQFALDDPVVSVISEFAGPDARRAAVTFRHLLTHTSGLPAHVNFRDEVGARAIVSRVCATPLSSAPGTSVVYSDLGFILLGVAIERLADRPLAEVLEDLVIAPLGLAVTRYCPPAEMRASIACTERDSWRGRLLQGEVHDENCWSMGGVSGHAGLFATASDVADLGELYRRSGATDAAQILSRHAALLATSECARSADERRGLGWALKTPAVQSSGIRFGPDSFGHTGYTGTSLWVDPGRAVTVALLTNRVYFSRDPVAIFELRAAVHDAIIDDLARAEQA
jgi:CubicO group peptidase (beta-lactamase class C family)